MHKYNIGHKLFGRKQSPPPSKSPQNLNTLAQISKKENEPSTSINYEKLVDEIPENLKSPSNNLGSNEELDYFLTKYQDSKKANWCFVGETNGKRVCSLSEGNKCMSGNIFPSKDICVNPSLR